jgi:hypothetical protein
VHIESYKFGAMVIDGREEQRDLIVTPSEVKPGWWRNQSHELTISDLTEALMPEVRLLVVGNGAYGRMRAHPELENELQLRGVAMEVMPTSQAVDRVNELLATHVGKWAAAFHLTC